MLYHSSIAKDKSPTNTFCLNRYSLLTHPSNLEGGKLSGRPNEEKKDFRRRREEDILRFHLYCFRSLEYLLSWYFFTGTRILRLGVSSKTLCRPRLIEMLGMYIHYCLHFLFFMRNQVFHQKDEEYSVRSGERAFDSYFLSQAYWWFRLLFIPLHYFSFIEITLTP